VRQLGAFFSGFALFDSRQTGCCFTSFKCHLLAERFFFLEWGRSFPKAASPEVLNFYSGNNVSSYFAEFFFSAFTSIYSTAGSQFIASSSKEK
jgi:hypothetical protein